MSRWLLVVALCTVPAACSAGDSPVNGSLATHRTDVPVTGDTDTEVSSAPVATSTTQPSAVEDRVADFVAGTVGSRSDPTAPFASIEHYEWLLACLSHLGFAAELIVAPFSPPTLEAEVPAGQDHLYFEANEACWAAAWESGVTDPPPTDPAGWERVYRGYEVVQACMVEHGFPVVEVPSLESFLESRATNWHPYDGTPFEGYFTAPPGYEPRGANEELQLEIQETCPADFGTILRDGFVGGDD